MTRPAGPNRPPQTSNGGTAGTSGTRPWLWLVPALTFVVGLLLGGVIVAASDGGGEQDGGRAQPTVTATPSAAGSSSGRTVIVPASCEQGLERARAALSAVGDAVDAARNLNTARLQELLDQLQDAQRDVERLAGQCRSAVPDRNRP